jgi:hypothetical protein
LRPKTIPAWMPGLAFLIVLGMVGAIFLHHVGIDSLQNEIKFQFYADSGTYHRDLENASFSAGELVQLFKNFLGPWLILKLAQNNYYIVLCVNILIFWFSVEMIVRAAQAKRGILYILLLANPVTLSSLLSVNKEIISLLAVALLIYSFAKGVRWGIFLTLVASVLVRWQLSGFCLVAILAFSNVNPLRKKRLFFCMFLLCVASGLAVAMSSVINQVDGFNLEGQGYNGYGFFNHLVEGQKIGLYWLVFIPKSLHLLFGLGLHMDRLVNPVNLYNDVWQLLHSTAMLLVFLMLCIGRRIHVKNDLIFLSIIYLIIFVLSPIYVPRYFYPVYVLWVACLACPGKLHMQDIRISLKKAMMGSNSSKSGSI